MRRALLTSLLAAALAAGAPAAFAQTTGNIAVSANVVASCAIVANPLAFGNYNALAATALQANTSVSVTCSQGSVASISLGAGNQASGAQRRMANATSGQLSYNLYQPASNAAGAACAYTTPWGNGTALGAVLVTDAAPDLTARSYGVCGEVPAGQNAPVAVYSDVVVAVVAF